MNAFSPSSIFHLSGVQRQVVEYVFIEQGDPADLVNRWGATAESIKQHIYRARANLAKKEIRLPDRRVKLRLKYRTRYGRNGL